LKPSWSWVNTKGFCDDKQSLSQTTFTNKQSLSQTTFMIIFILGPQGSGKGTQAKGLAEHFNLFYLSTGDMLREMAKDNPQLAEKLNKGELLSDEFVMDSLVKYLEEKQVSGNFILDGSPRSVNQYGLLKKWLETKGKKVNLVIFLNVSEAASIKRLSARRMDPATGKIYNIVTEPKPGPEVDKSKLIQRGDDKPQAIKERLAEYKKITEPLIELLRKEGVLFEVDGEQPIAEVQEEIFGRVSKF